VVTLKINNILDYLFIIENRNWKPNNNICYRMKRWKKSRFDVEICEQSLSGERKK
jgi:hypothetical protein